MKIKVIEVVIGNRTAYLAKGDPSLFNTEALVDNPLQARNFLAEPTNKLAWSKYDPDTEIMRMLNILHLKDDAWFAMSGLQVDACYTVEFEIQAVETDRKIGRFPHPPSHT